MNYFKKLFSFDDVEKDITQNTRLAEVVEQLEGLPEEEANYLALFSYLMARVAYADLQTSEEELKQMKEILAEKSQLSSEKIEIVISLVKERSELSGGTDNYLVARDFYEISSKSQREELLRCLFLVSSADDSITSDEEAELRKIAQELKLSDAAFTEIRAEFRQYREVLKGMPSR